MTALIEDTLPMRGGEKRVNRPPQHDRAEGEELAYTHEFLANILGNNRKSITVSALKMQAAGLITYRRGRMQVLDRPGLEKASCECYLTVKKRFDAFLSSLQLQQWKA